MQYLGNLHPLFVHLPIGIFLLGAMLKLFDWYNKKKTSTSVYDFILLTSLAFAVLSCSTGYLLSRSGDYDPSILSYHQYIGIGFTVALAVFYFLKNKYNSIEPYGWWTLTLLLIAAGHYGGSITHGEGFLLKESNNEKKVKTKIEDLNVANVYADIVQPILEEKCYTCHSAKKQKGNLRLDQIQDIIKGGKHGKAIAMGNASQSLVITRANLPMGDEEHMPPKGKPQLTDDEIKILSWWIDQNAPIDKTIANMQPKEDIRSVLMSFTGHESTGIKSTTNLIPTGQVDVIDKKLWDELKLLELSVIPIANNSNFVHVNIFSKQLDPRQWQMLQKLAKNIVWFKCKGGNLSSDGIKSIGMMSNLTSLNINDKEIENIDFNFLNDLKQLKVLNLSGSKVKQKDFDQLVSLSSLEKLYLYNTGITDISFLKKIFPNAVIDTGDYIVPTTVEDTTQFVF